MGGSRYKFALLVPGSLHRAHQMCIRDRIELKAQALHEHLPDFVRLYGRLADYRSKKTLYAILSNWYRYDFKTTAEAREYLFDDYFDLDIVRCTSDEVVVDLGAYTGDTVTSLSLIHI